MFFFLYLVFLLVFFLCDQSYLVYTFLAEKGCQLGTPLLLLCADPKNFFHRRSFFLFVFFLVCLFVFLINICVAFYNCFHDCLWDCTVFFVCLFHLFILIRIRIPTTIFAKIFVRWRHILSSLFDKSVNRFLKGVHIFLIMFFSFLFFGCFFQRHTTCMKAVF